MGVADRKWMDAPSAPAAEPWLKRLNAFGERHAKAILFASTVLIIVTVLVVSDSLLRKSKIERGLGEIDQAMAAPHVEARLKSLESLRQSYAGNPQLMPRILYSLGNALHELARLDEAERVYDEFLRTYPDDILVLEVQQARTALARNRNFLEVERPALAREPALQSHPLSRVGLKDVAGPVSGPIRQPNPRAVIELSGQRHLSLDLFEDEVPNTVANFVALCDENYFAGLTLKRQENGCYRIAKKTEGAVTRLLAAESAGRKPEKGSLVAARVETGSENLGAEFELLTAEDATLQTAALFGRVREESLHVLETLAAEEKIERIRIESKRGHEYKPETFEPKQ